MSPEPRVPFFSPNWGIGSPRRVPDSLRLRDLVKKIVLNDFGTTKKNEKPPNLDEKWF